jgi:nicotinamidase-related amidase
MAGNLGYDVKLVLDATHTFDRGGLTADELARATAVNLDGEFATVVSTRDVVG